MQNETKKGLVSVILPTRNRPAYLKQAIDSVYGQTYQAFEIVVVNDGSTEEINPLLAAYDHRLQVIRQEHRGVSAARNTGLLHATGEFVAFLDDDDLFLPDKLMQQVHFFEANPAIGWLCSSFSFMDGEGNTLARAPIIQQEEVTPHDIAMFRFLHTSSVMVRRNLISSSGFKEGMDVSEDYECWARILAQTQGAALPSVLSIYRLHKDSTSLSPLKLLRNNCAIIDAILASSASGLMPRAHYLANLHRIIHESLWHKRRYVQYCLFLLCRHF